MPGPSRLSAYLSGLPPAFWYLWLGTLINRLGMFVVPFLTLYLTMQRGVAPVVAATLVGVYGFGAFAASLAGGVIADRLGRRHAMLLSLFGGAAIMLAVPFVHGLATLAVVILLLGLLCELYRPAVSAAVADLVPSEDRPRAYALLYWVINVGAAVGPMVAGFVAGRSYLALFVADAATMALYGAIVAARVPESRPHDEPVAAGAPRVRQPGLGRALADPLLVGVSLAALVVTSVFMQAHVTLPLAMTADGLAESRYGIALAVNGVVVIATSLTAARLVARWPHLPVLAVSAVLVGLGFGLTAPASTTLGYAAAVVVWTLGEVTMIPVAPSLLAAISPERLRGSYMGVYHAAWGLAGLVGPVVGGAVLQRFGAQVLWLGCLGAGLLSAAMFLALAPLARRRVAAAGPAVAPAAG